MIVNMVSERLKQAYWDPSRKEKLMILIQSYLPGKNYIEQCLQIEYQTDKFVYNKGKIELQIVFDRKYIEFIYWLMMDSKHVDLQYLSLVDQLASKSKFLTFHINS